MAEPTDIRGRLRLLHEARGGGFHTVVGMFNDHSLTEKAINALYDEGFTVEQVSLVTKGGGASDEIPSEAESDHAAGGAGRGIAIGGILGGLIGIGALAIPGIGPVLTAGWITTVLGGAATGGAFGGWIGSMATLNVPKNIAREYAEQIADGNFLVMVLAKPRNQEAQAERILADAGAAHVQSYPYEARPEEFPGSEKITPAPPPEPETTQEIHDHMRRGMDVVGSNGHRIGTVKAIYETDFLVDRDHHTDIFIPISAVLEVVASNQTVVLSIPDYELPHLQQRTRPGKPTGSPDWEIPSLD